MATAVAVEPSSKRQKTLVPPDPVTQDGETEGEEERVMAIQAIQEKLNAIGVEEAKEVLSVNRKHMKRKRPLFQERQEAIAQVPQFWLKVLLAHEVSQGYIADVDQEALTHLESISVEDITELSATSSKKEAASGGGNQEDEVKEEDGLGFRVTFVFRENPFFSNTELWKEYVTDSDGDNLQVTASPIKWKDSAEAQEVQSSLLPAVRAITKAKASADNGDAKGDGEEEEDEEVLLENQPSFFSLFDDEEVADVELGEAIREDIFPHPLEIYLSHDFDEGQEIGGESDADAEDE
ncbi:unnamed protein product [Choristocarpus tenellus]